MKFSEEKPKLTEEKTHLFHSSLHYSVKPICLFTASLTSEKKLVKPLLQNKNMAILITCESLVQIKILLMFYSVVFNWR